ncbi:MAG: glycosyltransferase family 2 protein [Ilumatobacteraceae bacterium]
MDPIGFPPSEVELSLVMPAHNEAAVISEVVAGALAVLRGMVGDRFELIVIDDASTDGTELVLDGIAAVERSVKVVHLASNVGHGPALRAGWNIATGAWVAHLDSDDEIPAHELAVLWDTRGDADLVLGVRTARQSPPSRRAVTWTLRQVAGVAARRRLADANTPCKIVRSAALGAALASMPPSAFAPSVLLAVHVARSGGIIREVPVATRLRSSGRSWLVPTRLASGAAHSFYDTVMAGVQRRADGRRVR